MLKIFSKILIILLITVLFLNMSAKTAFAAIEVSLDKAYIEKIGQAKDHLKYYREDRNIYTYLVCSIVGYYDKNKNFNPTYCMNRNLVGAEDEAYYVTVKSLLDNDKVWRVIKNGYPYKSAKELGLTDKYDAFAVTKFAVYCILGEAKLDYFKAEKDDEEAVAMLKALKRLVQIGEKGTEKQDENPLSIKKVGSLKGEEEYYSQEYQVTSTADFSKYQVSKVSGLPEGAFIADTSGKANSNFNSETNFKVMIPKSKITKDIDISISIQAECKSYVILEGKTTVTKTQNYIVTAGEYATANTKTNLKLEANTGIIIVDKIDEDTKEHLEGVRFELYDSNKKIVDTKQTNSEGKLQFSNLYPGKYILKEVATNSKYILNTEEYEVTINYNEKKEIIIENKRKRGSLKIEKVDKDNNERLEGVEFDLYSTENKKIIGTYTTDSNGEIYIENLPIGEYKIIERKTNNMYNLADEVKVNIKYNETENVKIANEAKKGQIKIIKVDKDNNEVKIANVKFEVQDKEGNVLETIVTDKNGEAITSKYVLRDYESLYFKEVETDSKYVLNNDILKIKLEENKIKEKVFENEKIKGKIKIVKTTKDKSKITQKKAGEPLQGVKFQIFNSKNELVDTITTDKNGIALTKSLEKGKYRIKEIQTNKYYYLNQEEMIATIESNGEEVIVNIKNEAQNPSIDIEKNGPNTADVGKKIEYDISIRNTGNTSLKSFTVVDYLPSKYIDVKRFKTGTFNQDITYNLYYKSNFTENYVLLMEDLNAKENYEINFEEELADNEILTEIKLEFENVDIGFSSNENPHITGAVKQSIKSESSFTNVAEATAYFEDYKVYDKSKWKTVAYKMLPQTGF